MSGLIELETLSCFIRARFSIPRDAAFVGKNFCLMMLELMRRGSNGAKVS